MGSEEIAKENGVLKELRRSWSIKKQTGTGEAGLGLLEFGDVYRCDMEAFPLETGIREREGGGENGGAAKGEGIGRMGLSGIEVNPVVGSKRRGIKPGAIGEGVATDVGDGGLDAGSR